MSQRHSKSPSKNPESHRHPSLPGIWELDAIIASYLTPSSVWSLSTGKYRLSITPWARQPYTTGNDKVVFDSLLNYSGAAARDPTTSRSTYGITELPPGEWDGLRTLADLLGAGNNPVHNHRIFMTIHNLVVHALGVSFEPWRRSQQKNVLWDPTIKYKMDPTTLPDPGSPIPTSIGEYEALMDDISVYTPLIFPPTVAMARALNIVATMLGPNPPDTYQGKEYLYDGIALLLGLDLPTPFYRLVVDLLVQYGSEMEGVPEAFIQRYHVKNRNMVWYPTDGDQTRPYLATLDWIFYNVVSHRPVEGDPDYPVTPGRGYYRALEALASNKTLMANVWYSLVEEVIYSTDPDRQYRKLRPPVVILSDEAAATLLEHVLEAWPEIDAVSVAGLNTDYNTLVVPISLVDLAYLIRHNYYNTLDAIYTIMYKPLTRVIGGGVSPSDTRVRGVLDKDYSDAVARNGPMVEMYDTLRRHGVISDKVPRPRR